MKRNREQNLEFRAAVREIERILGGKLKKRERRRLHLEITGQGFSYDEIIQVGVALFLLNFETHMLEKAAGVQKVMAGVLGQPLWSVRLGVGSFITFDFGAKLEDHGRAVGAYHLWIYMCDWQMISKDRVIAHSELSRKVLEIAVRRFEGRALSKIDISQNPAAAVFAFEGDLKLACQAYDDAEADEELWMLFAPEEKIVSLAPQGILLEKESRSAARRAVNF